jgi:hypothetical protein
MSTTTTQLDLSTFTPGEFTILLRQMGQKISFAQEDLLALLHLHLRLRNRSLPPRDQDRSSLASLKKACSIFLATPEPDPLTVLEHANAIRALSQWEAQLLNCEELWSAPPPEINQSQLKQAVNIFCKRSGIHVRGMLDYLQAC